MNIITVTSDGSSAVVFGNSIIGNSPTELYVSVMTEILKAHPEIIGQKEPHFTSDKARADRYTGTTREVSINGMTVYINTGLSTKAKIKGIEKTCQLAGIGFEISDGGAVETAQATNNAVNTPASKPSVENDAIRKLEREKSPLINEEDMKIVLRMLDLMKVYHDICDTSIDNNKWYYSLYNNKMLRNIYGNIAQLNYGVKTRVRVQDNLGDWEIGQHNTPKGKEQLLKESVPVYEIPQIGKVNAYTFLNLVYENNSSKRKIIYAQNNTIYSQDIDTNEKTEICECNRVVSILAVRELLLVTEITDLRYDGRKSYEFQMGDFGYTSDDYTSLLQLRVINMIGWELLKVDNVDSAIVSAYISEVKEGNGGSKEIVKLELMDIWHNKLILENVEKENYQSGLGGKCSIRKINNIIGVINTNKLSKDKYEKNKNNVVLFNNEQVAIWNEEKETEYIYNMIEFFKEEK